MVKKNTFVKITTIILIVVLCALGAVALASCDKQKVPPQNAMPKVTYVYDNGEDNLVSRTSGGKAIEIADPEKPGYDFAGWYLDGENSPFDFESTVSADITLYAKWTKKTYSIYWQGDESFKYVFANGKRPNSGDYGTKVTFSVKVSVFYKGTPVVRVGTKLVTPSNDKYTFTLTDNCTVTVTGLSQDMTPLPGDGSPSNPYHIQTPAQFRLFAEGVSDYQNVQYNLAQVVLDNDLDFAGEDIVPVGAADDLYFSSMFMGVFYGEGHTISNFSIQSGHYYSALFGVLFGGAVYDLNVKSDLYIETSDLPVIAGGVVSYAFGGDVIGCSYSGELTVANGMESGSVYVGGIIGFAQGVYDDSTETDYYSTVSYCTSNATIYCDGQYDITAVGGIIGAAQGMSAYNSANVYNCRANVQIGGNAQRAGGIIGALTSFASVDNCYATGSLATSVRETTDNVAEAYKGGIAGEVQNECTIAYNLAKVSGCSGDVSGKYYGIAGVVREAAYNLAIDDREAVFVGNVKTDSDTVTVGGNNYNINDIDNLVNLMGWIAKDWKVEDGIVVADADNYGETTMDLTFVFEYAYQGETSVALADIVDDPEYLYGSMPLVYALGGDGFNSFIADNGYISYGYFLDPEHKVRVPASFFVNSHPVVIYVGFADYSVVANEYYATIGSAGGVSGVEVTLNFDDNGKMTMTYEGKRAYYMYVYDGEKIVIHDGYFVYLGYADFVDQMAVQYPSMTWELDYFAEMTPSGLKIYDTEFFCDANDGQTQSKPILAIKDNGVIGTWYNSQNVEYTFAADGTGHYDLPGGGTNYFVYTVNGGAVSMQIGGTRYDLLLSQDKTTMSSVSGEAFSISKYDDYVGIWESSFNKAFVVEIDGKGTFKIGNLSVTYAIDDETGYLTAEYSGIEFSAHFDENKLLVFSVGDDEKMLGREGSFMGLWEDTLNNYEVVLLGINKDGLGIGYDSNGYDFTYAYTDYGADDTMIEFYYRLELYGFGTAVTPANSSLGDVQLEMAVWMDAVGAIVDDFNLTYVDWLIGSWYNDDIELSFNGHGAYNIDITFSYGHWVVKGEGTWKEDENEDHFTYSYDRESGRATFTHDSVEYTVDGDLDCIVMSSDGNSDVILFSPDVLSDNDWYVKGETSIKKIAFDGKGKTGAGKVVVTKDDDSKVTYNYSVVDKDVTVVEIGGGVVYTLSTEDLVLCDENGDEIGELGVFDNITGKVYSMSLSVGGTPFVLELHLEDKLDKEGNLETTLGEGASAIDVKVVWKSEDILYVYYMDDGTLAFALSYDDESGSTLALAYVEGSGWTPLSWLYIPDALIGAYVNEDESAELFIDGSSDCPNEMGVAIYTTIVSGVAMSANYYVYYQEDGVWGLYDMDDTDPQNTVYTLVYTISDTEVQGAAKFETDDGKVIWLVSAN